MMTDQSCLMHASLQVITCCWKQALLSYVRKRQTVIYPMNCISMQIYSWEEDLLKA
jgi:hypothetical protein